MEADLKYATFNHDRSINELIYMTSLWQQEFEYVKVELSFIKHLLKKYPFKSKAQNMFERIQLFILDIDNFEEKRNSLYMDINQYKLQLKNIVNYHNLSKEIFNYLEAFKKLKIRIYQYINSLI